MPYKNGRDNTVLSAGIPEIGGKEVKGEGGEN
jgi:hypothetical protein